MYVRMSASRRQAALVVTLMGLTVVGTAQSAPVSAPVPAVWYAQSLNFRFQGASVTYSCAGLQSRLVAILRTVGVQNSKAVSCLGNSQARNLEVRVQTQHALEATAANIEAATRFDGKRRLLAHLRGEQLPSAADVPRFSARWQRIDLHRQRKLVLLPGDCELLQQVRDQLFPKLAIVVERDGLNCHSGSATRIGPRLRVVALLPEEAGASAVPQAVPM